MTLDQRIATAADRTYGRGAVGGVPICGILPDFFEREFRSFLQLKPEAAEWDVPQIANTMASLWLLDPEDLI